MDADEWTISRSTPGYRFDRPSAPAPQLTEEPAAIAVDEEMAAFVDRVVADEKQPVVMFAFQWCEFCWSLRKLFGKLGIDYRSVDLDSVEYQQGDRGGRIRGVLRARTGAKTIPQVFVGGRYVGGATDVFDAFRRGDLSAWLDEGGVSYDRTLDRDQHSLLPQWVHTRRQ
jgi:cysteine synthase A